jgi:hypothetical protein
MLHVAACKIEENYFSNRNRTFQGVFNIFANTAVAIFRLNICGGTSSSSYIELALHRKQR